MVGQTAAVLVALALGVVPGTGSRNDAACDGSATFTYDFKVQNTSHVKVYKDGLEVTVGFTKSMNANQDLSPGGSVVFGVAPTCTTLRIQREVPRTQATVLNPYSAIPAKTLEKSLDVIVMQTQEVERRVADGEGASAGIRADLTAEAAARAAGDAAEAAARIAGDANAQGYASSLVNGVLAGTGAVPQEWAAVGNGATTVFAVPGAELGAGAMYIVTVGGVVQVPVVDYAVVPDPVSEITFTTAPPDGASVSVRAFGYSRAVNTVNDSSLVTATGSSTTKAMGDWMRYGPYAWADGAISGRLLLDGPGEYGSAGLYLDKNSSHGGSHVLGFSVNGTPLWETGLDYENEDYVLAYSLVAHGVYPTADLIRIMRDRRMVFGPEVPKLSLLDDGFFNIYVPPDSGPQGGLAGVRIREYLGNPYVGDALRFQRYADTDTHWIHWSQGDKTRDWRMGMVNDGTYKFLIRHAGGAVSSAGTPGPAWLAITQDGNVGLGGQTNPPHELTVNKDGGGGASATIATQSNGSTTMKVGYDNAAGAAYIDSPLGGLPLDIRTGGTLRVRVDGAGNLFIANTGTAPASSPGGGGHLYVEGGALKFRGSTGTVTVVAPQ